MNPRLSSAIRGLVITAGIAVLIKGALAFRLEDWPIYITFGLLTALLYSVHVEVLPKMVLPVPGLALSIGFLYVGGLPIVVLHNAVQVLMRLLRATVPERWRAYVPLLVGGAGEFFAIPWTHAPGERAVAAAEHGMFALGLWTRWLIVSLLAPGGRPASHPGAMVVAEFGGYLVWTLLSALPIMSFRATLLRTVPEPLHTIYHDLGLIMVLALTPFVFLIAYGYETSGLAGAAAWSLSALGLHFMLQRLNERRVMLEEQNRRLETLNRELQHRERLSVIGKMSSVISHQMLQQLGVIGLHTDLMRNADDGDSATLVEQARRSAGAIEEALCDVNRVLTDLLVFSRDLRLNLYEHPLGRLVAECAEDCRPEAAARGVSLRVECPADIALTLDKLKMKQALANVVRNAIEASPPGGEVVVRAGTHDGWAQVAVSDQGTGVPEADRDAVFTPFFSTKEQGTGLGLAIAREFTEAHGGRLALERSLTPGATFVLRLPLRRAPFHLTGGTERD